MEIKQYLTFRRPYERSLRQLLLDFDFFREDLVGVNIHSVQHRLKTFESASHKASQLDIPIAELQDIAGMRIIVTTLDEVDVASRFFYRKADSKDLTIKADKRIHRKKNGYRARHLVIEVGGHYSRSVHSTLIEVQLLTLMQHTFNYISRAWIYKTERSFSEKWHREFLLVSEELAELDARISKLQKEVIESSSSGSDDEPLTPFSYQRIAHEVFGELEPIENCVDFVIMLMDLGCDSNGKLRWFFGNQRVLQVRERFAEMLNTTGRAMAEIALKMKINHFYMMYGVRLEASEEFVKALSASYEKIQNS